MWKSSSATKSTSSAATKSTATNSAPKAVSIKQQQAAKTALQKADDKQKAAYIQSMKNAWYATDWISSWGSGWAGWAADGTTKEDTPAIDTTKKQTTDATKKVQNASLKQISAKQQESLKSWLSSADPKKIESTKFALTKAWYDTSFFDNISSAATTQEDTVKQDWSFVKWWEAVVSHPTPNGKTYDIVKNADWTYSTTSKLDPTKKITKSNIEEMKSFLDSNNQKTWAENVNPADANKDKIAAPWETTVPWKEVVGTPMSYKPDNGKEYLITQYSDWTVSFLSQDPNQMWKIRQFNSLDEAKGVISNMNKWPVTPYTEENDQKIKEADTTLSSLKAELIKFADEAKTQWDALYDSKVQILSDLTTSLESTYSTINTEMEDLKKQSESLFDQNTAIEASQRANQLASKWYLTSDQAAAAAEYSIWDYKRNAELKKTEMYKTIAENKIKLAQEKQKAIAEISNNKIISEDARIAQINYINEWYGRISDSIDAKKTSITQFYDAQSSALDSMVAQNAASNQNAIDSDVTGSKIRDAQKTRAMTNEAERTAYYISNVQDVNLHKFVYQAIWELQKRGLYMSTKNVDAQFNSIVTAANKLQKASLK